MTARARSHRRWLIATAGVLCCALGLSVLALWPSKPRQAAITPSCEASVGGLGAASLTPQQTDNAALIVGVAQSRDLPTEAATIALATALQESKLLNLDYGDRDSLGLFQQRPSQGWGTPSQIMDPIFATNSFFDALVAIPDYQTMPVAEAAQAVQRSAYPDAYANQEYTARIFATALTGNSTAALTCQLPEAHTGDTQALADRMEQDFGALTMQADGTTVRVTMADPQASRQAWAVGNWGVALASAHNIESVQVADMEWTRTQSWRVAASSLPDGVVVLRVAGPLQSAGQS